MDSIDAASEAAADFVKQNSGLISSFPLLTAVIVVALIISIVFTACFLCRKVATYEKEHKRLLHPVSSRTIDNVTPLQAQLNSLFEGGKEDVGEVMEAGFDSSEDFWANPNLHSSNSKISSGLLRLASTKFIHKLSQESFQKLYSKLEWLHLTENEILFRAGDPSKNSGMYIVVEGKLGMFSKDNEFEELVYSYSRGDSFGEFSLLLAIDSFQISTCRALMGTDLVKISAELFQEIISDEPAAFLTFVKTTLASKWKMADYTLHEFFELERELSFVTVHTKENNTVTFDIDKSFEGIRNRLKVNSSDTIFKSMQNHSEKLHLSAGEVLIRNNTNLRDFYVVLQGKLVIYDEASGKSWHAETGEVLGIISLLTGTAYTKSVRTLSSVVVAVFSEAHIETNIGLVKPLIQAAIQQLYPSVMTFLTCGLQHDFQRGGQFLFKKDSPANEMFIIRSGRLRINPNIKSNSILNEVGRGQVVGETALLAHEPLHSYSIVCIRDSELVRISRASLAALSSAYPSVLGKLSSIMAKRLKLFDTRSNLNSRFSNVATIAIIPTSSLVSTHEFVHSLCTALDKYGKSKLIDQSAVMAVVSSKESDTPFKEFSNELKLDSDMSDDYLDRMKIQNWINHQEQLHRYLLFEGSFQMSVWTKLCVRQADLVLLVASSKDEIGGVSIIEQSILSRCPLARVELIILHDDTEVLPKNTARFLDPRPHLNAYHHIRLNNFKDYDRLSRYFASKSVGVVLSGGGARGLAHLGVLRALEDHEIPVDYIAGTSQGSLFGALYAIHQSSKLMEPACRLSATKFSSVFEMLLDITLPILSLFSGRFMNNMVINAVGSDVNIEDLWIPYYTVTTNISEGDVFVHRRGSLWEAVRASMSLLYYFPPMRRSNGDVIIDGGYCNNLPCDVMRDLFSPNLVVGVDIENKSWESAYKDSTDFGTYISGWWILAHRIYAWINPFAKGIRLPRFNEIVGVLNYINNQRNIRRLLEDNLIDLYIQPDLGTATLTDYHRFDEIVSNGYSNAKTQITAWKLKTRKLGPGLVRRHSFGSKNGIGKTLPKANSVTSLTELATSKIDNPLVNTSCASYIGNWDTENNNLAVFRGIPYAQPPIQELRWMPPKPRKCEQETIFAQKNGPVCMQYGFFGETGPQSEDCLSLNMYVPKSEKLLPIVVWIYGGSNIFGGISFYKNLETLPRTGKVCLAAMNYRLNSLGYLSLKELAQEDPRGTAGNYGIEDIKLALKWLQENGKFFGCDTSRVTLLGQSSGGTNILALLASSKNRGLFTGAISLSGSLNFSMNAESAQFQGKAFVQNTICANISSSDLIQCLRKLPADVIANATPDTWASVSFWPTSPTGLSNPGLIHVDGYTIEVSFTEAMKSKLVNVPIIMQSVECEMETYATGGAGIANMSMEDYADYISKNFEPWGPSVGKSLFYPYFEQNRSVVSSYYQMLADINNLCGNIESALYFANVSNSPIYIGYVAQRPSKPVDIIVPNTTASDAFHLWDYILAFKAYDMISSDVAGAQPIYPSPEEVYLGEKLLSHWIEFAETGAVKELQKIGTSSNYSVVQYGDFLKSGHIFNVQNLKSEYCALLKDVGLRPDERFYWVN